MEETVEAQIKEEMDKTELNTQMEQASNHQRPTYHQLHKHENQPHGRNRYREQRWNQSLTHR